MLLVFALAVASVFCAYAAAAETLRDAIEATYIYKLAPFVRWPASASAKQGSAFDVCVAGHDRVTALMSKAVQDRSVGGRPIVIRRLAPGNPPDGCAILYIAASADPAFFQSARGRPILTVSDAGGGPGRKAIVNFVVVEGHVRFDINEALAAQARLTISSKLLSLAHALVPPSGGLR